MKYHVRLTLKAELDVANVLEWFREQSATAAGAKWLANLTDAIARLETMPERCAIARESADLDLEIREILIGRRHGTHRVLFRIERRTVHILRIWHAARDAITPSDI